MSSVLRSEESRTAWDVPPAPVVLLEDATRHRMAAAARLEPPDATTWRVMQDTLRRSRRYYHLQKIFTTRLPEMFRQMVSDEPDPFFPLHNGVLVRTRLVPGYFGYVAGNGAGNPFAINGSGFVGAGAIGRNGREVAIGSIGGVSVLKGTQQSTLPHVGIWGGVGMLMRFE